MSRRRFSVEAASRPLHHCEHQERTLTSAPSTRPRPKTLLKQGKHIGRTFEEVCQTDRPYIDWVFREEKSGELSPNLAALVAYVRQKYGGLMTLGKHRGRYFSELLEQDPLYADWAMNVSCPGDPLRSFADYAAQASSKRKRGDVDENDGLSGNCMFCLEKPVSAAWIPCGHTVACFDCATSMPNRCPICRQIGLVQKLFVG